MINIKKIIKEMPDSPGIYIYRDKNKKVIYVGKAKKLKRRVSSYFVNKKNHSIKTIKLVENICDVEYILTDTEEEALILECNFIKRYRPKYNILLKDDKSYPFIKVTTNETYPRLFLTRHYDKDNAKYYGPYPNVTCATNLVELLNDRYKLRRCNNAVLKPNKRPCLNYDINLCNAPCMGKISEEDYNANVKKILDFLNGNYKKLIDELTKEMNSYSDDCNFEMAAKVRDQISTIKNLNDEQKITSTDNRNMDIVAIEIDKENDKTLVQILTINDGKMLDRKHILFEHYNGEDKKELLLNFIKQYYGEGLSIPKEIMIEEEIDEQDDIEKLLSKISKHKVTITVPKIGKNKRLLELAKSNAKISIQQYRQKSYYKEEVRKNYLDELKNILGVNKDLVRIESYDISHISGVDNVASMVCFTNGIKDPSEYRKFKINTVKKADDVSSMKEVLERRLNRFKNNDDKFNKLPDLIMMDGGVTEVNAALEIINKLNLDIIIMGLVKDDNHRTNKIYYDGKEILLDKSSELFKFITRVQDEVHRVAIGYFRKLHNKNLLASVLDDIDGIGEKKKINLFNKFKTIDKIKNATLEELVEVDGINEKLALNIIEYFKKLEDIDE
ncbi:MAG: excinuclease ABC subunit UvrC [Clostridia bacterium]|nr:excinuclease ABC subunit UvrC [Clostridia bacterium]